MSRAKKGSASPPCGGTTTFGSEAGFTAAAGYGLVHGGESFYS